MKRGLTLIFAALAFLACQATEYTSKSFSIKQFSRIAFIGGYRIHLVQSSKPFLSISGKAHIIEKIKVSNREGLLLVEIPKYRDRRMRLKSDEIPTLLISFKSINNLYIEGYADVSSSSTLTFNDLTVSIKGSSKLRVSLRCNSLSMDVSGASYSKLAGFAKVFSLNMRGAGMFDGYNLETSRTRIRIDGTGKARISAKQSLSGEINGFGSLFYKGNPTVDVRKNFGIVKQIP